MHVFFFHQGYDWKQPFSPAVPHLWLVRGQVSVQFSLLKLWRLFLPNVLLWSVTLPHVHRQSLKHVGNICKPWFEFRHFPSHHPPSTFQPHPEMSYRSSIFLFYFLFFQGPGLPLYTLRDTRGSGAGMCCLYFLFLLYKFAILILEPYLEATICHAYLTENVYCNVFGHVIWCDNVMRILEV